MPNNDTKQSGVLDAASAAALGARLTERADVINQITQQGLVEDLRTAARICNAYAELRSGIASSMDSTMDSSTRARLCMLLGREG
jgi:hypothetical protein